VKPGARRSKEVAMLKGALTAAIAVAVCATTMTGQPAMAVAGAHPTLLLQRLAVPKLTAMTGPGVLRSMDSGRTWAMRRAPQLTAGNNPARLPAVQHIRFVNRVGGRPHEGSVRFKVDSLPHYGVSRSTSRLFRWRSSAITAKPQTSGRHFNGFVSRFSAGPPLQRY
jgi:hypothetical protein